MGITWNSANRLEQWIARTREYADEVVLLVDESSSDETLGIARRHADVVRTVEHPSHTELFHDGGMRLASGEWVLWMDDDEYMDVGFSTSRDQLLDDRGFTHYLLPYRWVVRDDAGADRWLTTFPWHPNPRLRLFRNLGGIWWHRGRLHSPIEVQGEGRTLDPDEAVMYHLDLRLRSRAEREAKVARYRRGNAPSCEEYYLVEDYAETLTSEPVPEEIERSPLPVAQQAVRRRSAEPCVEVPDEPLRVAAEAARTASFWENAPVFSAEYVSSSSPTVVRTNRGYTARVVVRNSSPVSWRTSGSERGRITLGYHWVSEQHGLLLREGDRSLLDGTVEAGDTAVVLAGLWTPYEPGEYVLQWDLVSGQDGWFSERGVEPLAVRVTVTAEDRVLSKPRAVAQLPPAAAQVPAPDAAPRRTAASALRDRLQKLPRVPTSSRRGSAPQPGVVGNNVLPIPPQRLLDTRDGTGVPGAVTGPVAAGSVVTLRVTSSPHIPDYAVGLVATVSIPSADYNGFLNVLGGDGPPNGIVAGYFNDREPVAFQVLTELIDGQLSIWLSDNFPGTAHLLLDGTAYLTP